MLLVRDYTQCPQEAKGAVIALGNFDGVHRGHQAIIKKAKSIANSLDAPCAIMTFTPHPLRVLSPEIELYSITSFSEKLSIFKSLGVDIVYAIRFTPNFSQLTAEDFIENVLVTGINTKHLIIGHNFIFGHQRSGNSDTLAHAAKTYGYGFTQHHEITLDKSNLPVSSTSVRQLLQTGDVEHAKDILGRTVTISGTVIKGDQRGRKLGFPTLNIKVRDSFPCAHGVYACRVSIPSHLPTIAYGVANLGIRPTFQSDNTRLLEVHLFNVSDDLYGARCEVELVTHIRPEKAFASVDALKEAIECDILTAKSILDV